MMNTKAVVETTHKDLKSLLWHKPNERIATNFTNSDAAKILWKITTKVHTMRKHCEIERESERAGGW